MSPNFVSPAPLPPIPPTGPAVDFFSGALLGNGGLGAVVTTRPDAIVIRFGHNNVWDIRVAEDHADEIGTFAEIFERRPLVQSLLRNHAGELPQILPTPFPLRLAHSWL